jgi:hypothetical protein
LSGLFDYHPVHNLELLLEFLKFGVYHLLPLYTQDGPILELGQGYRCCCRVGIAVDDGARTKV